MKEQEDEEQIAYVKKGIKEGSRYIHRQMQRNRVSYKDYKTKLQEYLQKKKGRVPEYNTVGHSGPDHEQVFYVTVSLGGKVYGPASGKSKKHAEQNVAKYALIHLGLEPNDGSFEDRE